MTPPWDYMINVHSRIPLDLHTTLYVAKGRGHPVASWPLFQTCSCWGKSSSMVNCATISRSQKRQVHIPLFVVSVHKAADHFGQCLIEPLHETIRRRVVGANLTHFLTEEVCIPFGRGRSQSTSLVSVNF